MTPQREQERNIGDLSFQSSADPCETEGCEARTDASVWNGERWRPTCDEHRRAFNDELRRRQHPEFLH